MRIYRVVAVALFVSTVALVVANLVSPPAEQRDHLWLLPLLTLATLTPAFIGLLVVLRQPRNVVAWILVVGSLLTVRTVTLIPSRGWALQWDRAMWPLLYAWPIAIAFVFPNGRLLSPRWRVPAAAAVFCFVGFVVLAMFDPSPFDPPNQSVHNPMSFWHAPGWMVVLWLPLWLGILASLFVGAFAVRLRLRRSSGVLRLQTLWLAWAGALIPVGLVWCGLGSVIVWWFGGPESSRLLYGFLLVMETAVAAAVGIAVVRYKLYAIERLINRTLVYALLTVVLGATYASITVLLGITAGRGSAWVTATATLAVAAMFRPLRGRIQMGVDRRFDRQRSAGVSLVEEFEREVRDGRRPPEEVGAVVARALVDPLAEIVFWLPASHSFGLATGELLAVLPDDGRERTLIDNAGEPTAALLHDPRLLERPNLLHGIVRAAALSIEIARWRVEVRLQLQEVDASRARIVEAGYEERRRLERDLHDGAQQRLVSLGLQIRRMQRSLPREAAILVPALDKCVDEIGAAIADLRQIAAGVRPVRLDEGLASALTDLARTSPIPVEVDAPVGRLAASVEAAAYFIACEALTNAVKHASASKVSMSASQREGTLMLTVADDGIGGAAPQRGSGLAGLRDRVAAHGGQLEIASSLGSGTRIQVALPCAS
jgi:signal transduction histidine kinase